MIHSAFVVPAPYRMVGTLTTRGGGPESWDILSERQMINKCHCQLISQWNLQLILYQTASNVIVFNCVKRYHEFDKCCVRKFRPESVTHATGVRIRQEATSSSRRVETVTIGATNRQDSAIIELGERWLGRPANKHDIRPHPINLFYICYNIICYNITILLFFTISI